MRGLRGSTVDMRGESSGSCKFANKPWSYSVLRSLDWTENCEDTVVAKDTRC